MRGGLLGDSGRRLLVAPPRVVRTDRERAAADVRPVPGRLQWSRWLQQHALCTDRAGGRCAGRRGCDEFVLPDPQGPRRVCPHWAVPYLPERWKRRRGRGRCGRLLRDGCRGRRLDLSLRQRLGAVLRCARAPSCLVTAVPRAPRLLYNVRPRQSALHDGRSRHPSRCDRP